MRVKRIEKMKTTLNPYEAILFNRKESIQYYFNINVFDGVAVITNSMIYLVSKYCAFIREGKVICTNDVHEKVKEIMVACGIQKVYLDEGRIPHGLVKVLYNMDILIDVYRDEQLHKLAEDFDCLFINSVFLKKIIQCVLDEIKSGDLIRNICGRYKSVAFRYDIQDCFISIMPVKNNDKIAMQLIDPDIVYLFDCGIKYMGIYSDYTCTFKIHDYTKIELDCINLVKTLQEQISKNIKIGMSTKELLGDAKNKWNIPEYYEMSDGFGHSVGTEIHEPFSLYALDDFVFFDNMIFTIEPQVMRVVDNESQTYRIESTYTLHNGIVDNPFSTIPYINVLKKE